MEIQGQTLNYLNFWPIFEAEGIIILYQPPFFFLNIIKFLDYINIFLKIVECIQIYSYGWATQNNECRLKARASILS
jgi:hypothetical protein